METPTLKVKAKDLLMKNSLIGPLHFEHMKAMRSHLEDELEPSPARPAHGDWVDAPLVLLGSGSVYAQPFVAHALADLNVVACVDNRRRGQRQGDLLVQGDNALPELI
jgi:hypothetical protein